MPSRGWSYAGATCAASDTSTALRSVSRSTVAAMPAGAPAQVVGALVFFLTGFGLGWVNVAAEVLDDEALVSWVSRGVAAARSAPRK